MSKKQTLSQKLVEWVYNLKFNNLDSQVVHTIKRFILDHLGCVYAGVNVDSSQTITRAIMRLSSENAPCKVFGQVHKHLPPMAALINSTVSHSVEMDDDHREGTGHPGATIIPAALAVAEWQGNSGKELIEAILAGYEIYIRIAAGFLGKAYYSGWHPTATCGVFGAAMASGKLLGLDEDALTKAMGIAGTTSSGLLEYQENGSWTKRSQTGNASMNGVIVALLAREGFTSPTTILEGKNGFYNAYSHKGIYDLNTVVDKLGERFMAVETSIKAAACCRFSQPIVDCTLDLALKYDLKPDQVKDVLVKVNKFAIRALCSPKEIKYRPETVVDAQFSLPYAVGVSLVRRKALIDDFSPDSIKDPAIIETASKVRWAEESSFEKKYPKCYPASVTIWTTDGRELTSTIEYPKGDPENPVTDEELVEKFRINASYAIARPDWIEDIINATLKIEEFSDIRQFTKLLF